MSIAELKLKEKTQAQKYLTADAIITFTVLAGVVSISVGVMTMLMLQLGVKDTILVIPGVAYLFAMILLVAWLLPFVFMCGIYVVANENIYN